MAEIFISYSHKDEEWKDALVEHLKVIEVHGKFSVWDDRQIKAGDAWHPKIKESIESAKVAILLISSSFLTSEFIKLEEIPRLLQRQKRGDVRVIPLMVKPCAWKSVPWVADLQGASKDNKELVKLGDELDDVLVQLTNDVKGMLEEVRDNNDLKAAKEAATKEAAALHNVGKYWAADHVMHLPPISSLQEEKVENVVLKNEKPQYQAPKNNFKKGFPYLGFSILFFTCLISISVAAFYANTFITTVLIIACLISVITLVVEFKDERIQTLDTLERLTNLPVLGVIPESKQKDPLELGMMSQSEPGSAFAEAHRLLRTNLMFSTSQGAPGVLAITSAMSGEGKSTAAINVATVFAQSGRTVLLLDADLRNPSVHRRLQLDNTKGLTNYLTGQDHIESVTQSCPIPDVYVVTAGPMSPNPSELLSSERLDQLIAMVKTETFDIIILDLPPMVGLADACIVAARADATILTISIHDNKEKYMLDAIKKLGHVRANLVGTVATKVKFKHRGMQAYYYGYIYQYDDVEMLDALSL